MLDPKFGMAVVNAVGGELLDQSLKERCSTRMKDLDKSRLNMIFVPILERGQWWCAVISLMGKQIGVVDSMYPETAQVVHEEMVMKLCKVMDELLSYARPRWKVGFCDQLKPYTVAITCQRKMIHNSLKKLAAVKRLTYRMLYVVEIDPVDKEAGWIVHEDEDLLSDFNEERERVCSLVKSNMNKAQ